MSLCFITTPYWPTRTDSSIARFEVLTAILLRFKLSGNWHAWKCLTLAMTTIRCFETSRITSPMPYKAASRTRRLQSSVSPILTLGLFAALRPCKVLPYILNTNLGRPQAEVSLMANKSILLLSGINRRSPYRLQIRDWDIPVNLR